MKPKTFQSYKKYVYTTLQMCYMKIHSYCGTSHNYGGAQCFLTASMTPPYTLCCVDHDYLLPLLPQTDVVYNLQLCLLFETAC